MITVIDDKRPKDQKPASPESAFDPWADWKPKWTGKGKTPQDRQETHSPTESVSLRLTRERQTVQSQRRIVDARLWEAMTPDEQDAAVAIATAFEMIGRGMGYVVNDWRRIPGCKGPANVAEIYSRLSRRYFEWARACASRKISHSIVVDVLCFGFSCRAIDRDRRLQSGSTRKNLMDGLILYCELFGLGK